MARSGPFISSMPHKPGHRSIAHWLYACAAAVFLMAVIGAITRLTESGLSIAEWNPVMGALPPLSESEWQRIFDIYKETPQFKQINSGMDLESFKKIFFWEWFHRLWGRAIGVLYILPFLWFLARGKLPGLYMPSFIGFFILGGLQGAMGWYMVKSGLVDNPAVSHYRLASHLFLAMLLYALMLKLALKLHIAPAQESVSLAPLKRLCRISIFLTVTTMVWGAFVAGLDAGLIYNSFPMMGDRLWPSEILFLEPAWKNFVENPPSVQFTHRVLAIITFLSIFGLVKKSGRFHLSSSVRRAFLLLGLMIFLQIGLGIATLLTAVSLPLAVGHQAGAFLLLGLLIRIDHEIPKENFSGAT